MKFDKEFLTGFNTSFEIKNGAQFSETPLD